MFEQYYKNKLATSDKSTYECICDGIVKRKKEIRVKSINNIYQILEAVKYDHPEFFYVNWLDRVQCFYREDDYLIQVTYLYNPKDEFDIHNELRKISKNVAGMSHIGKSQSIHDWIVRNIKYDSVGLTNPIKSPDMFTAVGPIKRGRAVCEGISQLACLLMRSVGIDACIVAGYSLDGGPHAWNAIYSSRETLYSDITYDICSSNCFHLCRKYCNLTKKEMSKDHIFIHR